MPYTNTDIEHEKVLLVYFNTECDFCKEEVGEFKSRIKELSDLQLLLVSEESQATLQEFVKNNNLNQKPFTVLQSVDNQFYKTFGATSTPYALIYQSGELKATYKGLATVDAYLKHYESKL